MKRLMIVLLLALAIVFTANAEAHVHDWGDWIVDVEPTTYTNGKRHRICTEGHREEEVIPALSTQHEQSNSHTWVKESLISQSTCSHGELWMYTCPGCGDSRTNYIGDPNPSAHVWGDWSQVIAPTETEPGEEVRHCEENWEHVERRAIPALNGNTQPHTHDWKKELISEANCLYPALYRYTCTICSESKNEEEGSPDSSAHSWSEWKVERPATETEKGLEYRTCLIWSGHREERDIPMLATTTPQASSPTPQLTTTPQVTPQATTTAQVSAEPTATSQATTTPTTTPTPAPGDQAHEWGEWIVDEEPTCKEPGKKHRVCLLDATHTEEAIIPAEHDLQWRIRREPTTEKDGLRQLECVVCGEVVRVNRIPRLPELTPIDVEHFPDPVFRQFVSEQLDKDRNGSLSSDEAAVWIMNCSGLGIKDLEGIELFSGLIYLDCSGNELTELDLTGNMKLKTLIASGNDLVELDIAQDTDLCRAYEEGEKESSPDEGTVRYLLDDVSLTLDAETSVVVVTLDQEEA